jgi:hypothetical protein
VGPHKSWGAVQNGLLDSCGCDPSRFPLSIHFLHALSSQPHQYSFICLVCQKLFRALPPSKLRGCPSRVLSIQSGDPSLYEKGDAKIGKGSFGEVWKGYRTEALCAPLRPVNHVLNSPVASIRKQTRSWPLRLLILKMQKMKSKTFNRRSPFWLSAIAHSSPSTMAPS